MLLLSCVYADAENITSTVDGGTINTLPKVGQIVKEGEILVTFFQTAINAKIDVVKVEIKEAKELLANKILDKKRADKLIRNSLISKDEWEETTHDLVHAKLCVEIKEAELKKLEADKACYVIAAPFDCKVTKVYLIENSGTDVGLRILQVEKI